MIEELIKEIIRVKNEARMKTSQFNHLSKLYLDLQIINDRLIDKITKNMVNTLPTSLYSAEMFLALELYKYRENRMNAIIKLDYNNWKKYQYLINDKLVYDCLPKNFYISDEYLKLFENKHNSEALALTLQLQEKCKSTIESPYNVFILSNKYTYQITRNKSEIFIPDLGFNLFIGMQ